LRAIVSSPKENFAKQDSGDNLNLQRKINNLIALYQVAVTSSRKAVISACLIVRIIIIKKV